MVGQRRPASIRAIVALIIIVVGVAPVLVVAVAAIRAIQKSYDQSEQGRAFAAINHVVKVVDLDVSSLERTLTDYTVWTDAYYRVLAEDAEWIAVEIVEWLESHFGLNIAAVFDRNGDAISATEYGLENSLMEVLVNRALQGESSVGFVGHGDGVYLAASAPFLLSDGTGDPAGVLVIGNKVDGSLLSRWADMALADVAIAVLGYSGFWSSGQELKFPEPCIEDKAIRLDGSLGYASCRLLKDVVSGEHTILLVASPTPMSIATYLKAAGQVMTLGVGVAIVLILMGSAAVMRLIHDPIKTLHSAYCEFASTLVPLSVHPTGTREVQDLMWRFNEFTSAWKRDRDSLTEALERERQHIAHIEMFADMMLNMPVGLLIYSASGTGFKFTGSNASAHAALSPELSDEQAVSFFEALPTVSQEFLAAIHNVMVSGEVYQDEDLEVSVEGRFRVLKVRAFRMSGSRLGIAFEDVTDHVRDRRRLEYLGTHDPLTGLKNRTVFASEMARMTDAKGSSAVIAAVDVDGLKIINDTLGHDRGDALLIATAQVLRASIPHDALIARIGGDEFAAIIPGLDETHAERVKTSIMNAAELHKEAHPELPLFLSVGVVAWNGSISLSDAYRLADDAMYRDKLAKRPTIHDAIVSSLVKSLMGNFYKNEAHAETKKSMAMRLAEKLGLSGYTVTAAGQAALLHDIGMVSMVNRGMWPDTDPDVGRQLQRSHVEIGHRVAHSCGDFAHLAEFILHHHERWDGTGYPQGLSGTDIPLISRIVAVVGEYDNLTNPMDGRKAMTPEEAMAAIEALSDRCFDPQVVGALRLILAEDPAAQA